MAGDISKNALVVLAVVSIVISVLGTWMALSSSPEIGSLEPQKAPSYNNQAKISFEIAGAQEQAGDANIGVIIEEVDE